MSVSGASAAAAAASASAAICSSTCGASLSATASTRPRAELVDQRAGGAQREGLPGQRRARQREVRLDLLRDLVAEEERPAAGEGSAAASGVSAAALRAPPVLERLEEGCALRRHALRVHAAVGQEPQRRARVRQQHARVAQGAGGGAVEQQRIALRRGGREAPQDLRRDAELANERSARVPILGAVNFSR